jgi:hypothetical protein
MKSKNTTKSIKSIHMNKDQREELEHQRALQNFNMITSTKRFCAEIVASMINSSKLEVADTEQAIQEAKKWEQYLWSKQETEQSKIVDPTPKIIS